MIWSYRQSYQFASTTCTHISFDIMNKVTSLLLLHIHTYDLTLWIKFMLPVCFYYIYIHFIWFYKYNDQSHFTYVDKFRSDKYITSFHLLHIPVYDLILWINLPVPFYNIYKHMIWFYNNNDQCFSTNVHSIRFYQ